MTSSYATDFRLRYKDGGHTIRSTIAKNPVILANFMALCVVELDRSFTLRE